MGDLKTILLKASAELKEIALEVVEQYSDAEIKDAKARQKKRDISLAVRAFIELKQTDSMIYRLLDNYYGIDSISDANEYLNKAKITTQIVKLRESMLSQGMTLLEFKTYVNSNHIQEKLEQNPKLLEMTAEKLKAAIEK